jgi:hypothetical protein
VLVGRGVVAGGVGENGVGEYVGVPKLSGSVPIVRQVRSCALRDLRRYCRRRFKRFILSAATPRAFAFFNWRAAFAI